MTTADVNRWLDSAHAAGRVEVDLTAPGGDVLGAWTTSERPAT